MKKIIDGKSYNTETAEYLGGNYYSNPRDFEYYREQLYRTKKGTYFFYGEGGPHSKYAVYSGSNNIGGGEELNILTEEEAKEWAEEKLTAEEYCKAFGEPEEG